MTMFTNKEEHDYKFCKCKDKATMSVSSPKAGETCNCETGDHANAGGQEHGMFNQDIGRQTWQGQGLPQPKQDKDSCQCDEKPSEANKVPNADARLGDDEDEKKKAVDYMGLTEAEGNIVCSACGNQLKNHFGKAEDDFEPISGTSTGSGGKSPTPKKYSKKPSEEDPNGIINPEWKKHRAAQRVARAGKKRELHSNELMENMSPDVKLNYERNLKILGEKQEDKAPTKKQIKNRKRKPMSNLDMKRRRTRTRIKRAILSIKAMLERLKTEHGDGTWGMRGLGEGQGTTDVQGSGDTHLISPVKQKELDRLMAGSRYMPRSVSRKKKP